MNIEQLMNQNFNYIASCTTSFAGSTDNISIINFTASEAGSTAKLAVQRSWQYSEAGSTGSRKYLFFIFFIFN